ncbi:MAG TPA: TetR/AcrR family transcriptional regulator [Gammaproteobacteria bacterium]|nr:TetR/AcrR family transcriptional regulator [Gammaproteobacteria bacterium]
MPRASDKRERLIRSADHLILRQGFKQTTLSDIARDSGVPLGNVYYYFKTKDDIGHTVVRSRVAAMQALLDRYAIHEDPKRQLIEFLRFPLQIRDDLARNGCPLGTLAYELSRPDSQFREDSRELLQVVLDWSTTRFEAIDPDQGADLALQFVATLQGMSLVANALDDPQVVERLVERLRAWIESL